MQPLGELDKIDNVAARHDHVLIQFGEAGRAQRIAELPAQLPKFLAIFLARRHFQSVRLFIDEQLADCFRFASHAFFLPIEID